MENRKELKIKDLYQLNRLSTICSLMVNHNIEPLFYNYYFTNNIEWLVDNQEKIESDLKKYMNEKLEYLKFDIILNTNLDERINLITSINDIKEFSNYISYSLNYNNKSVEEKFKEFKSLDNYSKVMYFESIRRR